MKEEATDSALLGFRISIRANMLPKVFLGRGGEDRKFIWGWVDVLRGASVAVAVADATSALVSAPSSRVCRRRSVSTV